MWYKDPWFYDNSTYKDIVTFDKEESFCSTMKDYDEEGVWGEVYNCDQVYVKWYGVFWSFDTMGPADNLVKDCLNQCYNPNGIWYSPVSCDPTACTKEKPVSNDTIPVDEAVKYKDYY